MCGVNFNRGDVIPRGGWFVMQTMITREENDQPFGETNAPIVVAVDSSASGRHALEEAIRLADYTGAAVYAVDYIYDEEMETFDESVKASLR